MDSEGQPPGPASDDVRRRMVAQRRTGTRPEMLIRRLLHARGHRYRVTYRVPGAPRRSIDIAFPKKRVAVFVDGCFWHGCPEHYVPPRNNAVWWDGKISANRSRDAQTSEVLQCQGWTVLRLWEHVEAERAVRLIEATLG